MASAADPATRRHAGCSPTRAGLVYVARHRPARAGASVRPRTRVGALFLPRRCSSCKVRGGPARRASLAVWGARARSRYSSWPCPRPRTQLHWRAGRCRHAAAFCPLLLFPSPMVRRRVICWGSPWPFDIVGSLSGSAARSRGWPAPSPSDGAELRGLSDRLGHRGASSDASPPRSRWRSSSRSSRGVLDGPTLRRPAEIRRPSRVRDGVIARSVGRSGHGSTRRCSAPCALALSQASRPRIRADRAAGVNHSTRCQLRRRGPAQRAVSPAPGRDRSSSPRNGQRPYQEAHLRRRSSSAGHDPSICCSAHPRLRRSGIRDGPDGALRAAVEARDAGLVRSWRDRARASCPASTVAARAIPLDSCSSPTTTCSFAVPRMPRTSAVRMRLARARRGLADYQGPTLAVAGGASATPRLVEPLRDERDSARGALVLGHSRVFPTPREVGILPLVSFRIAWWRAAVGAKWRACSDVAR